mmetsp:Transcript_26088/g.29841  ORF Transcript_26088/g.29841 Transcript_26088/m.29841 type:complete len:133 (-) Transcript_26088:265-663(-)
MFSTKSIVILFTLIASASAFCPTAKPVSATSLSLTRKEKENLWDKIIGDRTSKQIIDEKWDVGFERLIEFQGLKGNLMVPQNYKVNDYKLGGWMFRQRENKRQGKLDEDKEKKLDDLGNWCDFTEFGGPAMY